MQEAQRHIVTSPHWDQMMYGTPSSEGMHSVERLTRRGFVVEGHFPDVSEVREQNGNGRFESVAVHPILVRNEMPNNGVVEKTIFVPVKK